MVVQLMADKLTHKDLTNIFISHNVPRDGHLYKYALRLQGKGTLDANNQLELTYMGFSSKSAFINYTNKLIQSELILPTFDEDGNLMSVQFLLRTNN